MTVYKSTVINEVIDILNSSSEHYPVLYVADTNPKNQRMISDCHIRFGYICGVSHSDPIAKLFDTLDEVDLGSRNIRREQVDAAVKKISLGKSGSNHSNKKLNYAALIMAGGFGTRLGELTSQTPKPLIEISGKPLIAYSVSLLDNISISTLYVSVFYLAEKFDELRSSESFLWNFEVIREETPLGTAGALSLLDHGSFDNLYILNADVVSSVDLEKMRIFHEILDNDITIGVVRHSTVIPFGVTKHTGFGEFVDIDEKPQLDHLIAAGIYIISSKSADLVLSDERLDMPDLLRRAKGAQHKINLFPIFEDWMDIGTPTALKDFKSQKR